LTVEPREVILADGTRLWLNTASAVDVEFTAKLRRLSLQAGEVLIETASDPAVPPRPFVVDSAQGRVRALGTRFSLHQQDDHSRAAVFEGAIEIQPATPGAAGRTLNAGQETRYTRATIAVPRPANADRSAWTRGMLLADNLPLGEFVAELARYRHGHLHCAPEVAKLRIVGAFPLADTDRVPAALGAHAAGQGIDPDALVGVHRATLSLASRDSPRRFPFSRLDWQ